MNQSDAEVGVEVDGSHAEWVASVPPVYIRGRDAEATESASEALERRTLDAAAEDGAGGAARRPGGGAGEAGALDPQELDPAEQVRLLCPAPVEA
jgi:hypothetical protein